MAPQDDNLDRIERDNALATRAFCDAWSSRDCDSLLLLLADDVRYTVYDGGPQYAGPAAIERAVRPFMAKYERIEFAIQRQMVIGPVVSHQRIEHYYGPDGALDTRFEVAGLLVFRAGRIAIWCDYALPGATQRVGPLCRQK